MKPGLCHGTHNEDKRHTKSRPDQERDGRQKYTKHLGRPGPALGKQHHVNVSRTDRPCFRPSGSSCQASILKGSGPVKTVAQSAASTRTNASRPSPFLGNPPPPRPGWASYPVSWGPGQSSVVPCRRPAWLFLSRLAALPSRTQAGPRMRFRDEEAVEFSVPIGLGSAVGGNEEAPRIQTAMTSPLQGA